MTKLTEAQARKIRHALGLTNAKESYRNYYCAAEPDVPDWITLVALGLAVERPRSEVFPYRTFHVTPAGREALAAYKKVKTDAAN